jgi:ankyrin repeat protein
LAACPGEAITTWEIVSGKILARVASSSQQPVGYLSTFSPNGKYLVDNKDQSEMGTKIWEVEAGIYSWLSHSRDSHSTTIFSPDSSWLALNKENQILLYKYENQWKIHKILQLRPGSIVYSKNICFSPDNKKLALFTYKTLLIWEVQQGLCVLNANVVTDQPQSVLRWHPSSEAIAIGGRDYSVKYWQIKQNHRNENFLQLAWGTYPQLTANEVSLTSLQDISAANKQLLQQHGADAKPIEVAYAFTRAIRYGDVKKTLELLNQKVSVSAPDDAGFTPLHYAVIGDHENIIQILIKNGADLCALDSKGNTPMHWASALGYTPILAKNIEVSNNAWLEIQNNLGETCLYVACREGQKNVVEMLIPSSNVKTTKNEGSTLLHGAAESGNVEIFLQLIDKLNPLAKNKNGQTPLHIAADKDHDQIVKIYLERKIFLDTPDNVKDFTALHYAANKCRSIVFKDLIHGGADYKKISKYNESALEIVVKQSHGVILYSAQASILKDLLAKQVVKADIEWLNMAIHSHNPEMVELFLLALAHELSDKSILGKALQQTIAQKNDMQNYHKPLLELLLNWNADPNFANEAGDTSLHLAVERGLHETEQLLLKAGADPHKANQKGVTPAQLRIKEVDVYDQLIVRAPDISFPRIDDETFIEPKAELISGSLSINPPATWEKFLTIHRELKLYPDKNNLLQGAKIVAYYLKDWNEFKVSTLSFCPYLAEEDLEKIYDQFLLLKTIPKDSYEERKSNWYMYMLLVLGNVLDKEIGSEDSLEIALNIIGNVHAEIETSNFLKESILGCEQTIKLLTKDITINNHLACYYFAAGVLGNNLTIMTQAENKFQFVLELVNNSSSYTNYANFYLQTQKYEKAVPLLIKALELNDESTITYNKLMVDILPQEMQFEIAALGALEMKASVFAYYLLGLAFTEMNLKKNYSDYIKKFEAEVTQSVNPLHYHLFAYTCKRYLELDKAILYFDLSLQVNSDNPLVKKYLRECKQLHDLINDNNLKIGLINKLNEISWNKSFRSIYSNISRYATVIQKLSVTHLLGHILQVKIVDEDDENSTLQTELENAKEDEIPSLLLNHIPKNWKEYLLVLKLMQLPYTAVELMDGIAIIAKVPKSLDEFNNISKASELNISEDELKAIYLSRPELQSELTDLERKGQWQRHLISLFQKKLIAEEGSEEAAQEAISGRSNLEYYLQKAQQALAENNLEEVIDSYEHMRALEPNQQWIHQNLAGYYFAAAIPQQNDELFIKAEHTFLDALELGEGIGVYTEFANFLIKLKQDERAIPWLIEAISFTPNTSTLGYGKTDQNTLHPELQAEINLKGQISIAAQVCAYYLLGIAYSNTQRANVYLPLLTEFSQIVEAHPAEPLNYMLLAYSYKRIGLYVEAGKYFAKVNELDKDHAIAKMQWQEIQNLAEVKEASIKSHSNTTSSFWSSLNEQDSTQQSPASQKDTELQSFTF